MADDARLVALVDSWIDQRDRMRARHQIAPVTQKEMLTVWNGCAQQLNEILPPMSTTQMQALTELFVQLTSMREAREAAFRRSMS
jgi:hypothetical protein